MLHKETVAPKTLDLIKRLANEEYFNDFLLVGGTALSLQIGHRISIDIDLFTAKPFDSNQIAAYLQENFNAESIKILKNGVFCFVEDVKVDVMSHQYPWVKPPFVDEGVIMSSLEDIGAMKLHAIVQSGSRLKDFIDVFFLLEKMSFNRMLNAYQHKYPDTNKEVVRKALLYHDDIKASTIDLIGKPIDLSTISVRLKDALINSNKLFNQASTALDENLSPPKRRKGRGI
ncbi:hypothetical protein BH10BAC4_BH10BAC4_23560 [soil metagenome]